MKEVIEVIPYQTRYLILKFKGEEEKRLYDTSNIRKGVFEKLNEKDFFEKVFVNEEIGSVTWEGELDLDPDNLFKNSITFYKFFK